MPYIRWMVDRNDIILSDYEMNFGIKYIQSDNQVLSLIIDGQRSIYQAMLWFSQLIFNEPSFRKIYTRSNLDKTKDVFKTASGFSGVTTRDLYLVTRDLTPNYRLTIREIRDKAFLRHKRLNRLNQETGPFMYDVYLYEWRF